MNRAFIVPYLFSIFAAGCACQAPVAMRIRQDNNDRYLPKNEIHFVEHGTRATGFLISASAGFDNPFRADWVAMLVPIAPTTIEGPAWSGKPPDRETAIAIHELPIYRTAFELGLYADAVRKRFRELSVWVLSTDPFIVGLPDGRPLRSWREFALTETGMAEPELMPLNALVARFVVERDLQQPISRLVVFPPDFILKDQTRNQNDITLVTLPQPMSIDATLDALAHADATSLGRSENTQLHPPASQSAAKEWGRAWQEDRDRLNNER